MGQSLAIVDEEIDRFLLELRTRFMTSSDRVFQVGEDRRLFMMSRIQR
jgi:hypothetical protein